MIVFQYFNENKKVLSAKQTSIVTTIIITTNTFIYGIFDVDVMALDPKMKYYYNIAFFTGAFLLMYI